MKGLRSLIGIILLMVVIYVSTVYTDTIKMNVLGVRSDSPAPVENIRQAADLQLGAVKKHTMNLKVSDILQTTTSLQKIANDITGAKNNLMRYLDTYLLIPLRYK